MGFLLVVEQDHAVERAVTAQFSQQVNELPSFLIEVIAPAAVAARRPAWAIFRATHTDGILRENIQHVVEDVETVDGRNFIKTLNGF